MRLLTIEDDQMIGEALTKAFKANGYAIDWAQDNAEINEALKSHAYDLILLDLGLPGTDGLELLHNLRKKDKHTPVLILTARDAVEDRVRGLDEGADDYMVKPFNLDELLARIRALLRRTQPERIPVLKFADLTLDTGSREATRGNKLIQLTAKEYELLELFMRHPRQVLTREVIFDRVWGYDFGGESNVLEVYIRYLRQKLEVDETLPRLIHTVRGVGYVMREVP